MSSSLSGARAGGSGAPLREGPKLLSLLNSTLSSSHELVRSISIVSAPSPSLVRPIRRNLSTLAEGIVALQREQMNLEVEGRRGKVSLAEVRQKEDEVMEVKGAWDRLCEMLERDERTAELLNDVKERCVSEGSWAHRSFARLAHNFRVITDIHLCLRQSRATPTLSPSKGNKTVLLRVIKTPDPTATMTMMPQVG